MPRPSLVPELLTQFAPLSAVLSVVERIAASESPVLITGERGTGKTLLARAIHSASRRTGQLREVDASAFNSELLDVELFGLQDEDGASRVGALEAADDGTVLIEEIAAVGHSSQVKLLHAMTRGLLPNPPGTPKTEISARVVATTAHSLPTLVRDGRFNDQLCERLRMAHVELPPLRDRRTDIPLLAQQFVAQFGGMRAPRLTDECIALLEEHSWPGNVRELRTVIERSVAISHSAEIRAHELRALLSTLGSPIGAPIPLADLERRHIEAILQQTQWHRARAAALLGISIKTLYRKIREYGFTPPSSD
jgi:DNA-binding NtrC family response regulator